MVNINITHSTLPCNTTGGVLPVAVPTSYLEAAQGELSLLLSLAAVQCGRVVAQFLQTAGQNVGALLLVHEDDDWRLHALGEKRVF